MMSKYNDVCGTVNIVISSFYNDTRLDVALWKRLLFPRESRHFSFDLIDPKILYFSDTTNILRLVFRDLISFRMTCFQRRIFSSGEFKTKKKHLRLLNPTQKWEMKPTNYAASIIISGPLVSSAVTRLVPCFSWLVGKTTVQTCRKQNVYFFTSVSLHLISLTDWVCLCFVGKYLWHKRPLREPPCCFSDLWLNSSLVNRWPKISLWLTFFSLVYKLQNATVPRPCLVSRSYHVSSSDGKLYCEALRLIL